MDLAKTKVLSEGLLKKFSKCHRSYGDLSRSMNDLLNERDISPKKQKILTEKHLKLAEIDKGDYIKLKFQSTIKKYAHVVLIKKNADNDFAFYDPNIGAVFSLTKEQLCKIVTQVFYKYTHLEKNKLNCFMYKLTIVALPALAIASSVTAVCGSSIVASVLFLACVIDLVVCYYLIQHLELKRQKYDTILTITSSKDYGSKLQEILEEFDNIFAELEKCPDKQVNDELKDTTIEGSQSVGPELLRQQKTYTIVKQT